MNPVFILLEVAKDPLATKAALSVQKRSIGEGRN